MNGGGVSAEQTLHADVLVIGGGPAGAWAALSARERGAARVLLVDKGYCGTSGATASANTGVWCIPPDHAARERSISARLTQSLGLGRRRTMERVLDTTWQRMEQLARWGYPFPVEDDGQQHRAHMRGPDYMAFMRQRLKRERVQVLDHSPALALLQDDGRVSGVLGQRLNGGETYRVHAAAVVLASGGVAFLSKTLGCDVNTGDGLLMAAELGAELSGMEFSAQYGICPAYSSVTKGLPYQWATFSDAAGRTIETGRDRQLTLASALLAGPVYAVLDRATPEVQQWLRAGQPNCFLPHDRVGIDPFRQRFPITLRCEGTVRGTGGVRIFGDDNRTGVAGLFAAGDVASRESLVGAVTGGGAPNAAWAIASGSWAGAAAAEFARGQRRARESQLSAADRVGLRPAASEALSAGEVIELVQAEALPLDKNLFRTGEALTRSLVELDRAWTQARASLGGEGRARVRAREAAALLASARFAYRSALARRESRGLHQRLDLPQQDALQTYSLVCSGLDEVSVHPHHAPQEANA